MSCKEEDHWVWTREMKRGKENWELWFWFPKYFVNLLFANHTLLNATRRLSFVI